MEGQHDQSDVVMDIKAKGGEEDVESPGPIVILLDGL
jgi:hypothetical protein